MCVHRVYSCVWGCVLFSATAGIAAVINFPLWKASAIAQSGYATTSGGGMLGRYIDAMRPPYKGVVWTMMGMTWARAAIFWGSDCGKQVLLENGFDKSSAAVLPPLVISTLVQFVNMPIVRASVTVQDPKSTYVSVSHALRDIYETKGAKGLWHGTSAGVMKTVPKYCTAIVVKDVLEDRLPRMESELNRSAIKSMAAGVAGAALTNPLDVLRNEMFKTDLSVGDTLRKLLREEGAGFLTRGMGKNMVAVALPIAVSVPATYMF